MGFNSAFKGLNYGHWPVLVNNQLDAQFLFLSILIPILYMFWAPLCSSSGESTVSIRHLTYVNYVDDHQVCRFGYVQELN